MESDPTFLDKIFDGPSSLMILLIIIGLISLGRRLLEKSSSVSFRKRKPTSLSASEVKQIEADLRKRGRR